MLRPGRDRVKMEIVAFEPDMAAGVAGCYNDLVAGVPHCAPVTAEAFSGTERLARPHVHDDEILVAWDTNGQVHGFVHLAVAAPPTEDWHPKDEPGLIRSLAYRPGERTVGQALLDAAERWVRDRSRSGVIGWSNDYVYPFYHLPFAHLSDRIGHVHPLFGMNGYRVLRSELLFDWPRFQPPAVTRPSLDFELRVEPMENLVVGPKTMRTGVAARAFREGAEAGHCEIARLGADFPRPHATDWCFCYALNIAEPWRGRGLGRFLLGTGLAEIRQAGCKHAAISTDWDNYRAALFYANSGYRLIDRTFSFRKELAERGHSP